MCFWFNIGPKLQRKINGSSAARSPVSSLAARERLVEAELHVFKLPPLLEPVGRPGPQAGGRRPPRWSANDDQADRRAASGTQARAPTNRSQTMRAYTNLYHLRTNLLEVSLYQILPRRPGGRAAGAGQQQPSGSINKLDDEQPLRLLDIRRIDLDSSGWETFYVKRAVEDWLRDSSLNLGLVIKAKSMFEEPIRMGLIRFADAYDHEAELGRRPEAAKQQEQGPGAGEAAARAVRAQDGRALRKGRKLASGRPAVDGARAQLGRVHRTAAQNFDQSHQPLLVIYTTTAN